MILYRGKSYPSREINFEGVDIIVSTEQLEEKLLLDMDSEDEHIADTAYNQDQEIFWYANEEEYAMKAELLSVYISKVL